MVETITDDGDGMDSSGRAVARSPADAVLLRFDGGDAMWFSRSYLSSLFAFFDGGKVLDDGAYNSATDDDDDDDGAGDDSGLRVGAVDLFDCTVEEFRNICALVREWSEVGLAARERALWQVPLVPSFGSTGVVSGIPDLPFVFGVEDVDRKAKPHYERAVKHTAAIPATHCCRLLQLCAYLDEKHGAKDALEIRIAHYAATQLLHCDEASLRVVLGTS